MSVTHTAKGQPAFQLIRSQAVKSLNLVVEEYVHAKTGAQHIHLACDNPENVFLVALRTLPEDSTGVAHILEHTSLCGSERFPVRDPFFMMTRRSLNTFMNAFTSSDWTAYPFASCNRKDFQNLLEVYLDAVFFARLDPLDFAQEGHRLEFQTATDPSSPLQYKGVVFNEMKGAMSAVNSQLWHQLSHHLFPTTTYHFNSGGEPDAIPDLTYEDLLRFYKTHYHPSNAIFMTYGDIPASAHHAEFESRALARFDRLETELSVPDEKRYASPLRVESYYALNDENCAEKSHVIVGWLLGHSCNLDELLLAHWASAVLLDHSASPLRHRLETCPLGQAPSGLCGLDDSHKEMVFVCGLSGVANSDKAPGIGREIENYLLDSLEAIARDGVATEDAEAALHQLELSQREVGGDGYPYGMQLIMSALTAVTHRGDAAAQLNIDASLEKLRERIKNPDTIRDFIRTQLLGNNHRVTLTLSPDPELDTRKEAAEVAKLASIKAQLSPAAQADLVAKAQALVERQAQEDDESLLPKVTLADVNPTEHFLNASLQLPNNSPYALFGYSAGTNGLVYQQWVIDMPALEDDLLPLLPLYCQCVTEMGWQDRSYLDVQRLQAQVSGGISAYASIRGDKDDANQLSSFLVLSSKALERNLDGLQSLIANTLDKAHFQEGQRLQELITQMRLQREQHLTSHAHSLAMQAAARGFSRSAHIAYQFGGFDSVQHLKTLDHSLAQPAALAELQDQLTRIHRKIQQAPRRRLLISEADALTTFATQSLQASPLGAAEGNLGTESAFTPGFAPHRPREAWLLPTAVNFCATAYPTVASNHPDAPTLLVLANVLRNGYLHRALREQGGAYGGGASQDNNTGVFRFYSYRDPRMADTLSDFDAAIRWVLDTPVSAQSLEEAILGVVSSLDKPDSPAGAAKREFHAQLHGRTQTVRQQFRDRLLATQASQLRAVAERYLLAEPACCVVTDANREDAAQALGLACQRL
jgi:presequence protease